jgi:hypothetical protein
MQYCKTGRNHTILQEEQRMDEAKKIPDEELDHVGGGKRGLLESIYEAPCPGCGHIYKIKDLTVKINCSCGTSFYPVTV